MIDIFRNNYDSELNFFYGRKSVNRNEIVVKKRKFNENEEYVYAEPAQTGSYAFGGTILFTSNGIFPDFNVPVKLHDRQMNLEYAIFEGK